MTYLFVPKNQFLKKKSKKQIFVNIDQLNEEWSELSDRKILKYIKKAENAYDYNDSIEVIFFAIEILIMF